MNEKDAGLETLRQIILEPKLGEVAERISRLERRVLDIDTTSIENSRKEIVVMKEDAKALRAEIEEIKNVIVGLDNKLKRAFGAFVKIGGGEG